MLRRAPTSILLSSRDVSEHLEHIDQQALYDRENLQPRHNQGLSSPNPSIIRLSSTREPAQKNEKGHITIYEQGPSIKYDSYRAEIQPRFRVTESPNGRHQDESTAQQTLSDEISSTQQLFMLENSGAVRELRKGSKGEGEEDFIPVNLTESYRFADRCPLVGNQEHDDLSPRASRNTYDYGVSMGVVPDGPSTFGKCLGTVA